jgi:hypothetical protein
MIRLVGSEEETDSHQRNESNVERIVERIVGCPLDCFAPRYARG